MKRTARQQATDIMHAVDAGVAAAFDDKDVIQMKDAAADIDAIANYVRARVRRTLRQGAAAKSGDDGQSAPMRYVGVWEESIAYGKADCVTDKGTLWYAHRPTLARPGTPDSGWQLMVKSR